MECYHSRLQSYNKNSETNDTLLSNNDTILSKYKIYYFYSRYSYGSLVSNEAYVMFKWGSPELQKGLTWYAKEAYLESEWGSLDSGQDVSEVTSRRIWHCVVTHLLLCRDVPDATSGRNFGNSIGDYTGKTASKTIGIEPKKRLFTQCHLPFASKTLLKITKNAWVSLFLWQYMADYGN